MSYTAALNARTPAELATNIPTGAAPPVTNTTALIDYETSQNRRGELYPDVLVPGVRVATTKFRASAIKTPDVEELSRQRSSSQTMRGN